MDAAHKRRNCEHARCVHATARHANERANAYGFGVTGAVDCLLAPPSTDVLTCAGAIGAEIFEMNNGCICCTVRGDLIRILGQLMKRKDKFDYIIVETTGLANPAPVAQTFWVDDEMKEQMSLDAIITVVDTKHVWLHIDNSSECQEQIAFADVILLNKIDLVSAGELEKLENKIQRMNPQAKVYKTKDADIDMDKILNVKAFDLNY